MNNNNNVGQSLIKVVKLFDWVKTCDIQYVFGEFFQASDLA